MLEEPGNIWFEGLEDGSPKFKWMQGVYALVDYTQAP